ncbi:MAG: formylglycine-generating enzyme family protein [Leptolyngbya sp. SIO1D8]|nr:formylglycine-generating enzyme family protein [Leptolyngbya sp. SIO1D8]
MTSSSTQLKVNKRQGTAQYYEEVLPKDVLSLRMMLIPAGMFLMGSPEHELERTKAEGPQHKVSVPQFFMAEYPVTQAQWRVVTAMPKVKRSLQPTPSRFEGDLRPVERVSWYSAVEFCDRLTIHTNRQYRLPTEAEWEYACRAGTTTPFHFGETITTEYANYQGTDGDDSKGEYREGTTPVNHFEGANAYGLCDMHGNVFEWCQDHWHETYADAPTDGSAWIKGSSSSSRVVRGGSWLNGPGHCRSAYRDGLNPGVDNYNDLGFRVVCSAPRSLP